ncbi:MAG: LysR family transcriptional regulator [Candidatus Competibacteraceae bacterium]|nr:LysR family transcriptional regulator [Candidatus Competibacteraceae bacterium]
MKPLTKMIPKISLKQLYYFVAVAEVGKVNTAANTISITPSSITEAIKHLERMLDTQLFERASDGMHLTFDGYRLLEQARAILRLTQEATELFRRREEQFSGTLELTITPAVMGYFLPGPYARFKQVFPNVRVILQECERDEIEARLQQGTIELAILLVSNLSLQRGVHVETLFRSRRALWCPAQHRFATEESVSVQALAQETFILLALDEADINIKAYLDKQAVGPAELIRLQTTEAVRSLVAQGAGVTLLSDLLYRPWSLEGARILRKPLMENCPSMNLGMVWPETCELGPLAALFANFLRREFKSQGAANLLG